MRQIVEAAALTDADTVIEVGPGLGVLTQRLLESAGRVIAVELDARLAQRLRETYADESRLTIVEGDVLALTPETLLDAAGGTSPPAENGTSPPRLHRLPLSVDGEGVRVRREYSVVSNLPYNAGAAIVRYFLEAANPPQQLVIMLQREVAASMTAAPGDLGLLGIGVQVYAEAKRLFNVPPRAFVPPPKVVSTVLRLEVRPEPLVPTEERDGFFRVVRGGFSAPRKQLRNSLAQGLRWEPADAFVAIEAAGIDPAARPETLSIDDWLRLARAVAASS